MKKRVPIFTYCAWAVMMLVNDDEGEKNVFNQDRDCNYVPSLELQTLTGSHLSWGVSMSSSKGSGGIIISIFL